MRAGKVTKGVQFLDNVDVGDPVAMARYYYEQGADELVFYDITASNERRGIMIDVVRAVAREIFIPFSVGGGLRTLEDMRAVLLAGAEKVSIDSGAVRNPEIIAEGARAFGSQCIVLSMQVKRTGARAGLPSGYEVVIDGGRTPTGRDALRVGARGRASRRRRTVHQLDRPRRHQGRLRSRNNPAISEAVSIPVIASGGAGEPRICATRSPRAPPTPPSSPRSSITASIRFPTSSATCAAAESRCATRSGMERSGR